MKMHRVDLTGKEICSICGAYIKWDKSSFDSDPSKVKDLTIHKDWCDPMGEIVYDRFEGTFARIFNILELALDDNRATKAKGLIGGIISETRNDTLTIIREYLNNRQ